MSKSILVRCTRSILFVPEIIVLTGLIRLNYVSCLTTRNDVAVWIDQTTGMTSLKLPYHQWQQRMKNPQTRQPEDINKVTQTSTFIKCQSTQYISSWHSCSKGHRWQEPTSYSSRTRPTSSWQDNPSSRFSTPWLTCTTRGTSPTRRTSCTIQQKTQPDNWLSAKDLLSNNPGDPT